MAHPTTTHKDRHFLYLWVHATNTVFVHEWKHDDLVVIDAFLLDDYIEPYFTPDKPILPTAIDRWKAHTKSNA